MLNRRQEYRFPRTLLAHYLLEGTVGMMVSHQSCKGRMLRCPQYYLQQEVYYHARYLNVNLFSQRYALFSFSVRIGQP
jgi:hypothetical protein